MKHIGEDGARKRGRYPVEAHRDVKSVGSHCGDMPDKSVLSVNDTSESVSTSGGGGAGNGTGGAIYS